MILGKRDHQMLCALNSTERIAATQMSAQCSRAALLLVAGQLEPPKRMTRARDCVHSIVMRRASCTSAEYPMLSTERRLGVLSYVRLLDHVAVRTRVVTCNCILDAAMTHEPHVCP